MIQYRVNTRNSDAVQLATFYDPWDVNECDRRYDWNKLTSLDVDKYILMDDGSNLYAKISYVSAIFVRTSAGVFRKKDIIHCSIAKYEFNGYSGASDTEESFEVRGPTKNEIAKSNQLLAGKKFKSVSQRVKMLSIEAIAERARDQGFSDEFVADALITAITDRDKHGKRDGQWLNALKILAKIEGNDLEDPNKEKEALIGGARFGEMITVQDKRKLANKASIEQAVTISDCRNESIISIYQNDVVENVKLAR